MMRQKTDPYYEQLMQKYLANECNVQETEELFDYLNRDQSNRGLLRRIKNEFENKNQQAKSMPTATTSRMWKKVEQRIQLSDKQVVPFFTLRSWQTAVAAVLTLAVLSAGFYRFFSKEERGPNPVAQAQAETDQNDILPGGNKAVLTLADGSSIILDDAKAGLLSKQGNIAISKTGEGQLSFNRQSIQLGQPQVNTTEFNTISTPKGGQYQVILPDGSKVWLNANSSLKFPTAFAPGERNVELSGEAYFEIAKDKKRPFKVLADHQSIQVLGTHFNVMAYSEEDHIFTTLLEGSVLVDNATGQRLLKPGQQSVLNKRSGDVDVLAVDPDESVAWKDGYFLFQGENIYSIMRMISRWYDVEVRYEGNMENKEFAGMISRFKNISEVLKMLELTGDVHFRVEGRRILVMP